ncbi:hypothetical protein HAX54_001677 [Datura stramonium]|uniref:Uncharacterized protein n=1 Tax=Datura stramonium TaxID=4076 RepID=A0ABS8WT87_DATST|nr:hypothetical protein [Datura stramonium]
MATYQLVDVDSASLTSLNQLHHNSILVAVVVLDISIFYGNSFQIGFVIIARWGRSSPVPELGVFGVPIVMRSFRLLEKGGCLCLLYMMLWSPLFFHLVVFSRIADGEIFGLFLPLLITKHICFCLFSGLSSLVNIGGVFHLTSGVIFSPAEK